MTCVDFVSGKKNTRFLICLYFVFLLFIICLSFLNLKMDGFVKIGEDWINVASFSRVTPTAVYTNGVPDYKTYNQKEISIIYNHVDQLLELEKARNQRIAEIKEKDELFMEDMKNAKEHRAKIDREIEEAQVDRKDWRCLVIEQRAHWKKVEKVLSTIFDEIDKKYPKQTSLARFSNF